MERVGKDGPARCPTATAAPKEGMHGSGDRVISLAQTTKGNTEHDLRPNHSVIELVQYRRHAASQKLQVSTLATGSSPIAAAEDVPIHARRRGHTVGHRSHRNATPTSHESVVAGHEASLLEAQTLTLRCQPVDPSACVSAHQVRCSK